MSAEVKRRHAALTEIESAGRRAGWDCVRQILALAPSAERERRVLGFVDAHFVAGIGPILRDERIGGYAGSKAGLVEIQERFEGRERLLAAVDVRPARVQRFVGRPRMRRDGAPVGPDLKQFIARFECLPDARAGIAKRLGAIGDAAMKWIGQRGPIERDERAPGEIVEGGKRVELGRGHVLDAIHRNERRDVFGDRRADGREGAAQKGARLPSPVDRRA